MRRIGPGRITAGASFAPAALMLSGSGGCTVKENAGRAGSADSVEITEYDGVRLDLMLAAKINGKVLDEMRGVPFQLVAESKLGYKWIKWVSRIELSDKPYLGFWERRGYSDDAEVPKARLEAD